MFWKVLSKYSSASFKRATDVHKEVFLELTEMIRTFKEESYMLSLLNFHYF